MSAPNAYASFSVSIGSTEVSLVSGTTTLQTITNAPGLYSLWCDLSTLTATELLELRVYEAARAGGTKRLHAGPYTLAGVQPRAVQRLLSGIELRNGWDITLKMAAGTARTIEWEVRTAVDNTLDAAVSTRATQASVSAIPTTAAPTAAVVATAVRSELGTELARVDVAISTREAETAAAGRATTNLAEHDATQAAILALPAAPSASSVAAAVDAQLLDNFAALSGQIGALPAPPSSSTIATAVDAALADNFGAVLTAVAGVSGGGGSNSDPLANPTSGYPAGTGGAALHRINTTPGTGPVVTVPAPPPVDGLCRVYGTLMGLDGQPAADVTVTFMLDYAEPLAASQRLLATRREVARTDGTGRLCNAEGAPYFDLARNDRMSISGTRYAVSCARAGLQGKLVVLNATTADLAQLVAM